MKKGPESWSRLERQTEKAQEKRGRKAERALHERIDLLRKLQDDNQSLEGDKDTFSKRIEETENLMGKVGGSVGEAADETTEQLFG